MRVSRVSAPFHVKQMRPTEWSTNTFGAAAAAVAERAVGAVHTQPCRLGGLRSERVRVAVVSRKHARPAARDVCVLVGGVVPEAVSVARLPHTQREQRLGTSRPGWSRTGTVSRETRTSRGAETTWVWCVGAGGGVGPTRARWCVRVWARRRVRARGGCAADLDLGGVDVQVYAGAGAHAGVGAGMAECMGCGVCGP